MQKWRLNDISKHMACPVGLWDSGPPLAGMLAYTSLACSKCLLTDVFIYLLGKRGLQAAAKRALVQARSGLHMGSPGSCRKPFKQPFLAFSSCSAPLSSSSELSRILTSALNLLTTPALPDWLKAPQQSAAFKIKCKWFILSPCWESSYSTWTPSKFSSQFFDGK